MNVDVELAQWSNLLIYSAMAVYAIAFIAYAFDLFGGRKLRTSEEERAAATGGAGTRASGTDLTAGTGSTADATASARSGEDAKSAVAVLERPAGADAGPADGPGDGSSDDRGASADSADPAGSDGAQDADASDGRSHRLARVGTAVVTIAILLHVAAVLTRALSVMRVPWGNMMEYALTASAIVGLVYLVALFFKDLRYLGTFVAGGLLVVLGLCITVFYTEAAQLIPALQSYWIVIHVPIAILSTALLSISAIMALFQIVKSVREADVAEAPGAASAGSGQGASAADADASRAGRRKFLAFMDRLPSSEAIEQASYRIAAVGFITWTFTLIAGAVWAEVAWGRYWGWDTKEIWTFVVWVVYAAYLHARATRGWGPTKVAVLNIIGFMSVIFNFAIVNVYFNGLHSYSGL